MKKKYVIIVHVVFWMFYILLPFVPLVFPDRSYTKAIYIYFYVNTCLNIINFYTTYLSARPDSKQKNKLVKGIIYFSIFVILFTFIRIYVTVGILHFFGVESQNIHLNIGSVTQEFINTLGFSFVPITIKFTFDWVRSQQLKSELQNQNQISEIALLKNQLNPHFLFNTLNNLYALVLKKSDDAPACILKLSGIMRYMLYDSNSEFVNLKNEIEYLRSYVELQMLRYTDTKFIQMDISGEIENRFVAPLLLISLVENAFKHCSKKYSPGIFLTLITENNKIIFRTQNFVESHSTSESSLSGIGLKNISRRLELLYPNNSKFNIYEQENEFIAEIIIENKYEH